MAVLLVFGNVSSEEEVLDYVGGYNHSLNGISLVLEDEDDLKSYYIDNYGYEDVYEFEKESIESLIDEDDLSVVKDALGAIRSGDMYIVFTEDDSYESNTDYDDEYYEDRYDYDNYDDEEWY